MTARTVVEALAGATIALSATIPATYDAAGYGSTDVVWTLLGEVENYGNHGVTAKIIEFTPVDTSVVTKMKGSKNYGTMGMMMGDLPSDAGQILVKAAAESNNHYSARITYNDGTVHYLDVIVAKAEKQDGSVDDVEKLSVEFAICRRPVEVPGA
jgi:hypothetical protein